MRATLAPGRCLDLLLQYTQLCSTANTNHGPGYSINRCPAKMPSITMMPRPCLKRSASSNWYKDKPHAYRGKHQVLVRFKPWAPQLLGALIVTSLLLSIFGLLRVHETLRIAVHLKATDDYALPSEPGLVDTVQHRLLLATHNVLAWYYPQYDVMEVLHQGEVCMSNMCCPNVATIQHKKQRFACTDAVATQM